MAEGIGGKPVAGNDEQHEKKPREYGALRLSEKVIGVLAFVVLFGWVFYLLGREEGPVSPGFPWFATGSITGAVLVIVLLGLKLNCLEVLPKKMQEFLLPLVSLLPVLGFLIQELSSLHRFFTLGGALALAYISATSYWKHTIPDFVTNPLGEGDAAPKKKRDKDAKDAPAAGAEAEAADSAGSAAPAAPAGGATADTPAEAPATGDAGETTDPGAASASPGERAKPESA